MTIFIDEYIQKGYCKWENGKIVVDKSCPEEIRQDWNTWTNYGWNSR